MSLLIRLATLARSSLSRHAPLIGSDAVEEFYRSVWAEAARELAAELVILPDGFLEIRLGERRTRVREHLAMIDHPATVTLSRSKAVVYTLLLERGLPVPDFRVFDLGNLRSAVQFLRAAGGPCVVKPRRGSHGGDGVTTNVQTRSDLMRAALYAWLYCRDLVIERQIPGDCYRLLYLDGVLIDAIQRRGPAVIGDGRSTVKQLIEAENDRRSGLKGAASNRRITITPECRATLRRAGLSPRSVLPAGSVLEVKKASNEASENDCESVRDRIGEDLIREGAEAAAALDIRLAGLDVITTDPAISLGRSGGKIIDVNATPGLHYHYQTRNPHDVVPVAVPILRALLNETPPTEGIVTEPLVSLRAHAV